MKKEDGKLKFIPISESEALAYGQIPRADYTFRRCTVGPKPGNVYDVRELGW